MTHPQVGQTSTSSARSQNFGAAPIPRLLFEQAAPATIGIWVISVHMIVDTIVVGQFVGPLAIGAITIVLPINFLISSLGMAIGTGGASMIARALGGQDLERAHCVLGQQVVLVAVTSAGVVGFGLWFQDAILEIAGGKGELLPVSRTYFSILLLGTPFLSWAMMVNPVIHAQGHPRAAMVALLIPAAVNVVLDLLFVIAFGWGLAGAAWATVIAYVGCAGYAAGFLASHQSELRFGRRYLRLKAPMVKEIFAVGSVSVGRQASASVAAFVVNNALFHLGAELAVAAQGIVNRVLLFGQAPLMGITNGMMPIVGFNHGRGDMDRMRSAMVATLSYGLLVGVAVLFLVWMFADSLAAVFTRDPEVSSLSASALRVVFLLSPLALVQLAVSNYYQAVGRAGLAFVTGISRQGVVLIPTILVLAEMRGLWGVWWAFPVADAITVAICGYLLVPILKRVPRQGQV